MGSVLQYMSNDLFRYKGILSINGIDSQYVFQVRKLPLSSCSACLKHMIPRFHYGCSLLCFNSLYTCNMVIYNSGNYRVSMTSLWGARGANGGPTRRAAVRWSSSAARSTTAS